jgi:hypothetical protein
MKTTIKNLIFRWTVSRGISTYGYNICTLFVDGNKVASCNGGGYDMQGTSLASWIQNNFQEKLKQLFAKQISAVVESDWKTYEDNSKPIKSLCKYIDGFGFNGVHLL